MLAKVTEVLYIQKEFYIKAHNMLNNLFLLCSFCFVDNKCSSKQCWFTLMLVFTQFLIFFRPLDPPKDSKGLPQFDPLVSKKTISIFLHHKLTSEHTICHRFCITHHLFAYNMSSIFACVIISVTYRCRHQRTSPLLLIHTAVRLVESVCPTYL